MGRGKVSNNNSNVNTNNNDALYFKVIMAKQWLLHALLTDAAATSL